MIAKSYTKMKVLVCFLISILCLSPNAFAEDIELYINALLQEKEKARVMLMFDTSGSMQYSSVNGNRCRDWYNNRINCVSKTVNGSAFKCRDGYNATYKECPASRLQVAKEAVTSVIEESKDVEFGIGIFDSYVSYIVAGIGKKSKSDLKTIVNNLYGSGGTPITDSAYQAYSYFSGGPVFERGYLDSKRDKSIEKDGYYISPFANLTGPNGSYQPRCDNNAYFIMMTDGDPSSNGNYHNAAASIQGLLPDASYTDATYTDENGNVYTLAAMYQHFPRIAEFMANNDVYSKDQKTNNVKTFTIGFGNGMSDKGQGMLEAAAKKGNGDYYDTSDPTQLNTNLKATLRKIVEVSGNFTSPSVAASQSDSTRTKEYVYYSLFSPLGSSRWNGNIKKLKINGYNIVDQDNKNAINSKGEIDKEAKTFWRDYEPSEGDVPSKDGSNVMLGGLDEQITNPAQRSIFTDLGNFSSENTTVLAKIKVALKDYSGSSATDQEAKDMIDWMRGFEKNEEGEVALRDHILGDALHSKPAAITYGAAGSDSNDSTYLLFGTNAGFVHFFEDTSETKATEVWSFIPSELFSIQPGLRDNIPGKLYGMDLTPTIYHDDANGDGKVNSTEKVWAFMGMRRGGSTYYALDISDRQNPKLLWAKGASDYPNLGQTWSQPRVVYINLPSYAEKPLLVFGAGYDKEQFENGASNTVGAGVYIVDAETGNEVWSTDDISFGGNDSIVGRVATLDSDYDGYTDRLYAADTGGKVWRIDLAGSNTSDWSAFEFASLPGKFFYQPEVARSYYSRVTTFRTDNQVVSATRMIVPFEAVVIGSGDRTSPLDQSSNDSLYMMRDINVITKSFKSNPPASIDADDLMAIDTSTFGSLTSAPDDFIAKEAELAKYSGWKYALPGMGEKALAKPAIIGGVAYFPTFMAGSPNTDECSLTGGTGRLYALHLHYAVNVYKDAYTETGDSIPPTPELVFSEDGDEKSQFLLIGIGAGENNSGIIKAKSINDSAVPELVCDENGENCKINLTSGFAGFRTHRSYMYRETSNKVN